MHFGPSPNSSPLLSPGLQVKTVTLHVQQILFWPFRSCSAKMHPTVKHSLTEWGWFLQTFFFRDLRLLRLSSPEEVEIPIYYSIRVSYLCRCPKSWLKLAEVRIELNWATASPQIQLNLHTFTYHKRVHTGILYYTKTGINEDCYSNTVYWWSLLCHHILSKSLCICELGMPVYIFFYHCTFLECRHWPKALLGNVLTPFHYEILNKEASVNAARIPYH